MSPFSVTALSPGATYVPGFGFTLPDITGTTGPPTEYNLICELAIQDACLTPGGGDFEFELQFDDDCGSPYVLPVKQQNWSLSGDVPSLDISKENVPGEIYLGETIFPTITVTATNVDLGPVIVTDTVPLGWSVLIADGGNVFTVGPQIYITWTVSGVTTTVLNPVIQSPISDTGGGAYCGTAAINTVKVRATDCQTCTHTAQDSTTTYIQCEDILSSHDKQVSPLAVETCTSFVYTSTYVFASSFNFTPTWQDLIFTDTLLNQTCPGGSAGIQVSNGSSCAATFSETVVNGELVLTNISPTCGVNLPGATMVVTFSAAITAPNGCDDLTFYDWSYLNLGVTGNGYCADDGILEEGVFVTVDMPQMAIGIQGDPANVEPCAEYPITLTLTLLPGAPAYDVVLRFDTTDYAVVQVLGFGGPMPYFTHTGPLSYTWFYSDDFTTITTATVYLFVQRRCQLSPTRPNLSPWATRPGCVNTAWRG